MGVDGWLDCWVGMGLDEIWVGVNGWLDGWVGMRLDENLGWGGWLVCWMDDLVGM